MQSTTRTRRLLGTAAAAAAAALAVAVPVAVAGPDGPQVPSRIAVEEGHKVFLVARAEGVQIYSCAVTANGHEWGLVAPRATLHDASGKVIGTHFGGPTWKANDGSSVVGRKVDGVTVDNTAIQWLLISAASKSDGADGSRLGATTFIQRTATSGGLPPVASTCNAMTVGSTSEIAYTAEYHFWKRTGG